MATDRVVSQSTSESAVVVRAVTAIIGTVVALTFLFGFGNVLNLALRRGVPVWVAPLVAFGVGLVSDVVVCAEWFVGFDEDPCAGAFVVWDAGGHLWASGRVDVSVVMADHEVSVEVLNLVAVGLVQFEPGTCVVGCAGSP